jgi:hypothetical protein
LAKHGIGTGELTDLFGVRGRAVLKEKLTQLPQQTRFASERVLEQLESLHGQIKHFEERMRDAFEDKVGSGLYFLLRTC